MRITLFKTVQVRIRRFRRFSTDVLSSIPLIFEFKYRESIRDTDTPILTSKDRKTKKWFKSDRIRRDSKRRIRKIERERERERSKFRSSGEWMDPKMILVSQ